VRRLPFEAAQRRKAPTVSPAMVEKVRDELAQSQSCGVEAPPAAAA
jgi:hypothetical protein